MIITHHKVDEINLYDLKLIMWFEKSNNDQIKVNIFINFIEKLNFDSLVFIKSFLLMNQFYFPQTSRSTSFKKLRYNN